MKNHRRCLRGMADPATESRIPGFRMAYWPGHSVTDVFGTLVQSGLRASSCKSIQGCSSVTDSPTGAVVHL